MLANVMLLEIPFASFVRYTTSIQQVLSIPPVPFVLPLQKDNQPHSPPTSPIDVVLSPLLTYQCQPHRLVKPYLRSPLNLVLHHNHSYIS